MNTGDREEVEDEGDPAIPLIRCRFTIVGDERFDPDEVTRRTELSPSYVWRKGDAHATPSGRSLPPRPSSCWSIATERLSSIDLPAILDGLLDVVETHRSVFLEVAASTGAEIEVSAHIHMSDQTPIGSISVATLRRIVGLNADFDLDLYVVDDVYLQG